MATKKTVKKETAPAKKTAAKPAVKAAPKAVKEMPKAAKAPKTVKIIPVKTDDPEENIKRVAKTALVNNAFNEVVALEAMDKYEKTLVEQKRMDAVRAGRDPDAAVAPPASALYRMWASAISSSARAPAPFRAAKASVSNWPTSFR